MTPYEIHEIIQRSVERNTRTLGRLGAPDTIRFPEDNTLGVPPGLYKQEHGIWLLTDQIEP